MRPLFDYSRERAGGNACERAQAHLVSANRLCWTICFKEPVYKRADGSFTSWRNYVACYALKRPNKSSLLFFILRFISEVFKSTFTSLSYDRLLENCIFHFRNGTYFSFTFGLNSTKINLVTQMFLHVLINNKTIQMFKITISPAVTDMFLQSMVRISVKWVSYGYWLETSSEKIRLKRMIHAKSASLSERVVALRCSTLKRTQSTFHEV